MKDKQLDKLIKKVANQPSQKDRKQRFVDPTLKATARPDADESVDDDRKQLFKEMKRREF